MAPELAFLLLTCDIFHGETLFRGILKFLAYLHPPPIVVLDYGQRNIIIIQLVPIAWEFV